MQKTNPPLDADVDAQLLKQLKILLERMSLLCVAEEAGVQAASVETLACAGLMPIEMELRRAEVVTLLMSLRSSGVKRRSPIRCLTTEAANGGGLSASLARSASK